MNCFLLHYDTSHSHYCARLFHKTTTLISGTCNVLYSFQSRFILKNLCELLNKKLKWKLFILNHNQNYMQTKNIKKQVLNEFWKVYPLVGPIN